MINTADGIAPREDRPQTVRVVGVVIAAKALLFLTIYLSISLLPPIFDGAGYEKRFHWPQDEPAGFHWMFKTWDGGHYLYLSEEGYADAGASAAFHPLWPALIAAGRPIFGGSLWAALILANLLSAAGLVILHRFAFRIAGSKAADTALLLAIAFPGAIYYCFPYSESLFLFISVSVFYLLASDRIGAAAALSILAPLTRAVGIFLVIPLAWKLITDCRRGKRPRWQIILATAPLLGFALTLAIMWLQTGNPFIGFEAQSNFASEGSTAKILDPVSFFRSFVDVWGVHGVLHSGLDRVFFVLMLIGIWLTGRLERGVGPLTTYGTAMVLVPAVTMSFMAFIRYSSAAFPIYLGVGAALSPDRRRGTRWFILALLMIVQFFFLIRHVNSLWAA